MGAPIVLGFSLLKGSGSGSGGEPMRKLPPGSTTISGHSAQSLNMVPSAICGCEANLAACWSSRLVPFSSGINPLPDMTCAPAACTNRAANKTAIERIKVFKISRVKVTKPPY